MYSILNDDCHLQYSMLVALKQFVVIYKQFINNKKYNIKLGDVFLKDILFECFFSTTFDNYSVLYTGR